MNFDEEFDKDLDEDLEPEEEKPKPIKKPEPIKSKTPAAKIPPKGGKKVNVYFMSTIGPGEKKQKLAVNDGNLVSDIKKTVGNLFGLNPEDFHLSSGGITMDESTPLKEYDISDGDDILLIPSSTAGS